MSQVINAADAGVAVVTTSAVTIAGIATGLSYDILIAGFAGALCSLSFMPSVKTWGRLWTLVTSTLFAGYVAPVALVLVLALVRQFVDDVPTEPLVVKLLSAYGCGLGAQVLLPIFMEWMKRRAQQKLDGVA
jgi:hypothetical protein